MEEKELRKVQGSRVPRQSEHQLAYVSERRRNSSGVDITSDDSDFTMHSFNSSTPFLGSKPLGFMFHFMIDRAN